MTRSQIIPPLSSHVLNALVAGAIGGAIFQALSIPLPWMLGSMVVVAVGAAGGAPFKRSMTLRRVMLVVMGLLLGSFFNSETISHLSAWSVLAIVVSLYVIAMTISSLGLYRRIGDMSLPTAYFSSTPGGLGAMTVAGEEAGGDNQLIPIAHMIRIFCVVIAVPAYLTFVLKMDLVTRTGSIPIDILNPALRDWLMWLGCAGLGFLTARSIRLPFAEVLGPMLLSAVVYSLEWITIPIPSLVTVAAQVVIGTSIGAQFSNLRRGNLLQTILASVISTALMLTGAVLLSQWVGPIFGADPMSLLLALVPGGLVEMSLIAISIHADTAFVGAMHIWRIFLIVLSAPLLFRIFWQRSS